MTETSDEPFPTFRTARLTLRPRTLADLDACVALNHDPLVTQFIPGPWADPIAHRAFVEERIRHAYPPGMGYWCLFAPAGFIGWVFVAPEDLHGPEIEIGWRLVRAAWGHGYATEAARGLLRWAFDMLDLNRVQAETDTRNVASARVLEKLGFVREGTLREDCIVNGEVSDSWVYGLIRREWRPASEPVPAS